MTAEMDTTSSDSASGLLCGCTAFLIWGASPLYWKQISAIPAFETLMHRVVWSFLFLFLIVVWKGKTKAFFSVLKTPRTLLILSVSTLLISCNWFLFIWSVNADHLLQTSLGYYINPLVMVFLGLVFLKEKLSRLQAVAVGIAAIAVAWLTWDYGMLPWVSLALAFSFGTYGMIRKIAPVGALEGLTVETLLLSGPACAYLFWVGNQGTGAFLHQGAVTDFLLMISALVTGFPLLLFNMGTRRLHLATVGFLQYIAPTCTFVIATFVFKEPLDPSLVRTFVLIWVALSLVSWDSIRRYRSSAR